MNFLKNIFRNAQKKFDPFYQIDNALMKGKDSQGNMYYEKEVSSKLRRFYVPPLEHENDVYPPPIEPEWEAWLRYKRDKAPSEEEISSRIKQMLLVKQKAANIDLKHAEKSSSVLPKQGTFPTYRDYD